MKKIIISLAILLSITLGASAQNRGLFDRGPERQSYGDYYNREGENSLLGLPTSHGDSNDQNSPLGSGALLLIGFGAAYTWKKGKQNAKHIP